MRDPYDILGVGRGASFDEVRAAYRRACKSKHPDIGGSHAEFVELQNAYEHILKDLKRGFQQQREEAPRQPQAEQEQAERQWERAYRDIDDELEELRRAAETHEEALRAMRTQAWAAGERVTWARLTWNDLSRFFRTILRSGLKGLTLLFAALIGIGSVLVEANVVSAIVILGAGIGVVVSLAFKSDKGGILSAGLLLFGVMTIWLPPVRAALFSYPLATISVLVCLALIFKFAQQGGTVGLMTGGVLALYVIFVIVGDTQRQQPQQQQLPPQQQKQEQQQVTVQQPSSQTSKTRDQPTQQSPRRPVEESPSQPSQPQPAPEPRTLLAAKGAVLKFVAGVPYHLKVRTGFTTLVQASQGQFAFYAGDAREGDCTERIELTMGAGSLPYQEIDRTIRACGPDAVARVIDVR